MRGLDRQNIVWAGVPVTNGVRLQSDRIHLDGGFGLSLHSITQGGAAGQLSLYQTNFEPTMSGLNFNPDDIANCQLAPGTPVALAANAPNVLASSATASTPFAKWIILSFLPSASGVLWLSASVRKLS